MGGMRGPAIGDPPVLLLPPILADCSGRPAARRRTGCVRAWALHHLQRLLVAPCQRRRSCCCSSCAPIGAAAAAAPLRQSQSCCSASRPLNAWTLPPLLPHQQLRSIRATPLPQRALLFRPAESQQERWPPFAGKRAAACGCRHLPARALPAQPAAPWHLQLPAWPLAAPFPHPSAPAHGRTFSAG